MQVFISFSSADRKIAEKIYDRLKKNGIGCWICTKDIPPGADYQSCIVDAINACEVVVLVFSSMANLSPEIAKELSLASKKILIPARIEDVVPQGSFQYQLSNRQFVDLFDDFDNKLDELADRINSVLASTAGKPAAPVIPRRTKNNIPLKLAGAAVLLVLLAGAGWMLKGNLADPGDVQTAALPRTEAAISPPLPASATAPAALAPVHPAAASASSSPPAAVAPAASGPLQVGTFLPLLSGTETYDRINALRSLAERLPMGLSAADANALLDGAGSQRPAGLKLIASRLATELDGKDIVSILDSMTTYDRINSLKLLVSLGKVEPALSAAEANAILEGSEGQRPSGITALASRMEQQLNGKDAAIVLGNTETYDRVNSLRVLVSAGKLATALTPDEANLLLQGTAGQRSAGIQAIANNLAADLGGKGLATILGDTATYDRVNSLSVLSKAERIGKLQNEDLELVLQNTEEQRTRGMKMLAKHLMR